MILTFPTDNLLEDASARAADCAHTVAPATANVDARAAAISPERSHDDQDHNGQPSANPAGTEHRHGCRAGGKAQLSANIFAIICRDRSGVSASTANRSSDRPILSISSGRSKTSPPAM